LDKLLNVSAVIVAYQPNAATLHKVAAAITTQVDGVLIIANDSAAWSFTPPRDVSLAKQDTNRGLGAAYNLAAGWARTRGATHLLLLDQDSVPGPGMVGALREAFGQTSAVAAAGPLWRDTRSGQNGYFLRFSRWGVRKIRPAAGEIVPVDFLISSGSLISLDAFDDIGRFDEELFVEHVDTDWVLRARAKGYRLFGVANAQLDHTFGEAVLFVGLPGLRRQIFLYPPERNYYLLRNSITLSRRRYVPWRWALHDISRTILFMLFYLIFVPPRRERLRPMVRAVRDGLNMK
jgi:rhamnosyltransferase